MYLAESVTPAAPTDGGEWKVGACMVFRGGLVRRRRGRRRPWQSPRAAGPDGRGPSRRYPAAVPRPRARRRLRRRHRGGAARRRASRQRGREAATPAPATDVPDRPDGWASCCRPRPPSRPGPPPAAGGRGGNAAAAPAAVPARWQRPRRRRSPTANLDRGRGRRAARAPQTHGDAEAPGRATPRTEEPGQRAQRSLRPRERSRGAGESCRQALGAAPTRLAMPRTDHRRQTPEGGHGGQGARSRGRAGAEACWRTSDGAAAPGATRPWPPATSRPTTSAPGRTLRRPACGAQPGQPGTAGGRGRVAL